MCRENKIDSDSRGWNMIMFQISEITTISSFNNVDGLGELFAGGATEAALGGKNIQTNEALYPIIWLLARNKDTIAKLNLR